jgi:hypothetical protein
MAFTDKLRIIKVAARTLKQDGRMEEQRTVLKSVELPCNGEGDGRLAAVPAKLTTELSTHR